MHVLITVFDPVSCETIDEPFLQGKVVGTLYVANITCIFLIIYKAF